MHWIIRRSTLTGISAFFIFIVGSDFLAHAAPPEETDNPVISIIIDDIGYRLKNDIRAIALPGPLAYGIMPHAPHSGRMSELATSKGKEIILHLPMQALNRNEFLGPGALTLNMTRKLFLNTLDMDLNAVPNVIGVNNHMGSLLTRHPGHMQWLMEAIKTHGYFYIDSLTSEQSIAAQIAKENQVPYIRRDVFLDNEQDHAYIRGQFMELVKTARRKGSAVGIGHPNPGTIDVLMETLPNLQRYGVQIINLQEMINLRNGGERK